MFSAMSVCLSFQSGGLHVNITHDALDLIMQGPPKFYTCVRKWHRQRPKRKPMIQVTKYGQFLGMGQMQFS